MPDFSEYADDAKKFASEHSEQSDSAFDKAAEFADEKTGNRFDSQIQQGERAGENYLGVQDQDQQGQQQGQGQYGGQDQSQGGGQYGDQNQGDQYGDQGDQNQGGQY
jgi:MT0933-like antitoxin protein